MSNIFTEEMRSEDEEKTKENERERKKETKKREKERRNEKRQEKHTNNEEISIQSEEINTAYLKKKRTCCPGGSLKATLQSLMTNDGSSGKSLPGQHL